MSLKIKSFGEWIKDQEPQYYEDLTTQEIEFYKKLYEKENIIIKVKNWIIIKDISFGLLEDEVHLSRYDLNELKKIVGMDE